MQQDKPRVAYLTSGAAGMYCGSCMHDNTLARGLSRAGVDIQLIPTYTPIRTDEDNVSIDRVFFGGINVYLQQKIPMFRRLPGFLDRFLDQPWLIRKATSRAVEIDAKELGGLAVSMLKGLDGNQRKEVKRLAAWLKQAGPPELVVLTNILIGGCIPHLKEILEVPVIVTLQGDDIFLEELPDTHRSQALEQIHRLVPFVDRFIAHSRFYADAMSDYLQIPRERIEVIPLGIDLDDFESALDSQRESPTGENPLTIGYLARLAPEKGLHLLVDAFIELRANHEQLNAQLKIAGWLGEHRRQYAEEQFAKLDEAGLSESYEYVGSIDRAQKVDFLMGIDVLSVPTTYREPKGLFVLEALACGVPFVLPDHGAFPEIEHDTGGGVLVQPNDASELALNLAEMLTQHDLRASMGKAGQEAVKQRRNSETMSLATRDLFVKLIEANRSG